MGNTSSSANNRSAPPGAQDSATFSPSTSSDSPHRTSSRRSRSQAPKTSLHVAPPTPRSPSLAPSDAPVQSPEKRDTNPVDRERDKPQRLPHRSLRTKKKSLELPDLALAITPASSGTSAALNAASANAGPYRRPQASSPIAIPSRPGPGGSPGQTASQEPRLKTIPTAVVNAQPMAPMAEVIVQPAGQGRGRGNPHIRGAPLQYSSTRSFAGTTRGGGQPVQPMQSFALRSHPHGGFIPENVHSSIPLALRKAEFEQEEEAEREDAKAQHVRKRGSTEEKHPAQVCIVWRGGGRNVQLMRAGDNNWKGRQQMEYDDATNEWRTWVSLMPGTHHIRFLVDGVHTTAEDLPTAVDDSGSLANYVAVPISGYTPPSASLHPTPREQIPPTSNGQSFFADASINPNEDAEWTDKVPWQLECAAEEEEQWLTHGQQARSQPPQHPQAPSLPRHLEKLIMNQKPPGMGNRHYSSGGTTSKPPISSGVISPLKGGSLPVTTASGTNLTASTSGSANFTTKEMYTKLVDSAGLADDGSVLPVPSHVVLHHLGTSAIRNGVLAVANTTRYKKKFITTIYYKPT